MGTLDRKLPDEYQTKKAEGDRLLEEGDAAGAKLALEAAWEMLEEFMEAETAFIEERLDQAHAELFEVFVAKGDEAREAGETEAARGHYECALEVAPDRTARDHVRVKMELASEEEDEGSQTIPSRLERLQKEIEEDPEAPEPVYNLGVELALDGFLEAAAEQFQRVIELSGDDVETQALAYFRLANVYSDILQHTLIQHLEAHEHHKSALDHYAKALELGYDPPDVHYRIGQVYELIGDHDNARKAYDACLGAQDDHLSALSALAHCFEVESRDQEALPHLERLVQLDPEDSEGFYRIGLIKERLGDTEAALSAFDEAERVDPDGEFAYFARERSDELRGRAQG